MPPTASAPSDLATLAEQFLLRKDITFLNHGSFGACPKPVFEKYQAWQRELESQPVEFLGRRTVSLLGEARAVLAEFVGTSADNVVYVPNITWAMNAADMDEDTLMGIVLDAGADDLKTADSTYEITCDPTQFSQVQAALEKNNLKPLVAEIPQVAKASREVDVETGQRIMRLMEALDDHDDVQNVYSDLHISDALMAEMNKE